MNGKSHFDESGTQNYLVFQTINKYFKVIAGVSFYYLLSWTSEGLSNESTKPRTTYDNSLTPILHYYGTKKEYIFDRACLKQDKVTFNHGKIVNIYIVYEIIRIANINGNRNNNLTVQNALFGAVGLTRNADVNKYKYSRYATAFDRTSSSSLPGGGDGQNVIIFVVDMNSSIHVDNKGKYILIIGKRPTQRLGEHSLTSEKMYLINLSKDNIRFYLSFHTMEQIVICLVMAQKLLNLKQIILKL